MKNMLILSTFFSALFICCYADSDRMNCRENLSYINEERDVVLTGLLLESMKGDPSNSNKLGYSATYYNLYQKSMEKQRHCDNNLILKIFSPETDDLK